MAFSMPDGVSQMRGGGLPLIGFKRNALDDHAAELVQVNELGELLAVSEGAGRGEHGVLELDPGEVDGEVGFCLRILHDKFD